MVEEDRMWAAVLLQVTWEASLGWRSLSWELNEGEEAYDFGDLREEWLRQREGQVQKALEQDWALHTWETEDRLCGWCWWKERRELQAGEEWAGVDAHMCCICQEMFTEMGKM